MTHTASRIQVNTLTNKTSLVNIDGDKYDTGYTLEELINSLEERYPDTIKWNNITNTCQPALAFEVDPQTGKLSDLRPST